MQIHCEIREQRLVVTTTSLDSFNFVHNHEEEIGEEIRSQLEGLQETLSRTDYTEVQFQHTGFMLMLGPNANDAFQALFIDSILKNENLIRCIAPDLEYRVDKGYGWANVKGHDYLFRLYQHINENASVSNIRMTLQKLYETLDQKAAADLSASELLDWINENVNFQVSVANVIRAYPTRKSLENLVDLADKLHDRLMEKILTTRDVNDIEPQVLLLFSLANEPGTDAKYIAMADILTVIATKINRRWNEVNENSSLQKVVFLECFVNKFKPPLKNFINRVEINKLEVLLVELQHDLIEQGYVGAFWQIYFNNESFKPLTESVAEHFLLSLLALAASEIKPEPKLALLQHIYMLTNAGNQFNVVTMGLRHALREEVANKLNERNEIDVSNNNNEIKRELSLLLMQLNLQPYLNKDKILAQVGHYLDEMFNGDANNLIDESPLIEAEAKKQTPRMLLDHVFNGLLKHRYGSNKTSLEELSSTNREEYTRSHTPNSGLNRWMIGKSRMKQKHAKQPKKRDPNVVELDEMGPACDQSFSEAKERLLAALTNDLKYDFYVATTNTIERSRFFSKMAACRYGYPIGKQSLAMIDPTAYAEFFVHGFWLPVGSRFPSIIPSCRNRKIYIFDGEKLLSSCTVLLKGQDQGLLLQNREFEGHRYGQVVRGTKIQISDQEKGHKVVSIQVGEQTRQYKVTEESEVCVGPDIVATTAAQVLAEIDRMALADLKSVMETLSPFTEAGINALSADGLDVDGIKQLQIKTAKKLYQAFGLREASVFGELPFKTKSGVQLLKDLQIVDEFYDLRSVSRAGIQTLCRMLTARELLDFNENRFCQILNSIPDVTTIVHDEFYILSPNLTKYSGTLLAFAVDCQKFDIVKILVEQYHVDINQKIEEGPENHGYYYGVDALAIAAWKRDARMVAYLLAKGANTESAFMIDNQLTTVYEFAQKNGYQEIVEQFESARSSATMRKITP